MPAFRVTNALLIIEAIRRTRGRKIPHSDPPAYEYSHPYHVYERLSPWMSTEEMKHEFNLLLIDQVIVAPIWMTTTHEFSPGDRRVGLLRSYDDAVAIQKAWQWFSLEGEPLSQEVVRKAPSFISMQSRGLYVVGDGLPRGVRHLLHTQKYIYPLS